MKQLLEQIQQNKTVETKGNDSNYFFWAQIRRNKNITKR